MYFTSIISLTIIVHKCNDHAISQWCTYVTYYIYMYYYTIIDRRDNVYAGNALYITHIMGGSHRVSSIGEGCERAGEASCYQTICFEWLLWRLWYMLLLFFFSSITRGDPSSYVCFTGDFTAHGQDSEKRQTVSTVKRWWLAGGGEGDQNTKAKLRTGFVGPLYVWPIQTVSERIRRRRRQRCKYDRERN